MMSKILVAVIGFATLALVFVYLKNPYSDSRSTTQTANQSTTQQADQSVSSQLPRSDSLSSSQQDGSSTSVSNPFGVDQQTDQKAAQEADQIAQSETDALPVVEAEASDSVVTETFTDSSELTVAGIRVSDLGIERWQSDEQFEALIADIDANPELLDALLVQYRETGDPLQLKQLTELLARFDNSDVASTAGEIARYGNPENRLAALDLLRQVHPSNPEARDVIIEIVETDQDPAVLSRALVAIAAPTEVSYQHRQSILAAADSLTTHADPAVRAHSYGIIAGWTDDAQSTPLILGGLDDPDPIVRRKVTSSLLNYRYNDGTVKTALIQVASNGVENKRTRLNALRALGRMSLTDAQRSLLRDVSNEVNRSPNR